MEQARAFNLSDIERIDREFLRAVDIAPVLGVDPQDILAGRRKWIARS